MLEREQKCPLQKSSSGLMTLRETHILCRVGQWWLRKMQCPQVSRQGLLFLLCYGPAHSLEFLWKVFLCSSPLVQFRVEKERQGFKRGNGFKLMKFEMSVGPPVATPKGHLIKWIWSFMDVLRMFSRRVGPGEEEGVR